MVRRHAFRHSILLGVPANRPIGLSVETGVYRPTALAFREDSSNKRLLMQVRDAAPFSGLCVVQAFRPASAADLKVRTTYKRKPYKRAGQPACSYQLQRWRVGRQREADINVQAKREAWTGTCLFAGKQGRAGAGVRSHASPESTASGEAGPAGSRALEAAAGRHFPADH